MVNRRCEARNSRKFVSTLCTGGTSGFFFSTFLLHLSINILVQYSRAKKPHDQRSVSMKIQLKLAWSLLHLFHDSHIKKSSKIKQPRKFATIIIINRKQKEKETKEMMCGVRKQNRTKVRRIFPLSLHLFCWNLTQHHRPVVLSVSLKTVGCLCKDSIMMLIIIITKRHTTTTQQQRYTPCHMTELSLLAANS